MAESAGGEKLERKKFGWIKGVFVPSILTIFGVIMYLRLGWVLGNAGMAGTALIVTISTAITFLTALSIAAIATNMKVGSGGAYYMISRSFGVEAGAAVGLPLFLAQALGISFYIAGFAESVHHLAPFLPAKTVALGALVVLTVLALISADLALKAQFFILAVIISSLVSFAMGRTPDAAPVVGDVPDVLPFWQVFAVFFPAVTGIEAGVSMSGDLRKPSRALPLGTILAVLVGYIVYLAIPWVLAGSFSEEVLRTNYSVVQQYAKWGWVVVAGIWGASLSSALGSMLGAPRTLQAIARDRALPRFLSRGSGASDEPRVATAITFAVAFGGIMLGDLNVIAPILSMFFLTSYGFLNLITALEGIIGSPSWRPSFKTPWALSLLGAVACLLVMLMIDPGATFIAGAVTFSFYWITKKRKLRSRWADMRRGILLLMARYAIYRLSYHDEDIKTWRPNLLVLTGSPTSRWHLVNLARSMSHGKGFLTIASIVPEESIKNDRLVKVEKSVQEFLRKRKVNALVEVTSAKEPMDGAKHLIRNYGMGPLFPNTIMLGTGEGQENFLDFAELILLAKDLKRNVVIARDSEGESDELMAPRQHLFSRSRKRIIEAWWGLEDKRNTGFMLAVSYLLRTSPEWKNSELVLRSLVKTEEEREGAEKYLNEFLETGRIHARAEVAVIEPEVEKFEMIHRLSKNADLVLMGLKIPKEETAVEYGRYYGELMKRTATMQRTVFVMASQDLEFREIFE